MLNVRKLTSDEVTALESTKKVKGESGRVVMAALYDDLLAEYNAGDYAEVKLAESEKKLTVRKHITRALFRRNLTAEWKRGKADTLKFHIVDPAVGNGHDGDTTG